MSVSCERVGLQWSLWCGDSGGVCCSGDSVAVVWCADSDDVLWCVVVWCANSVLCCGALTLVCCGVVC